MIPHLTQRKRSAMRRRAPRITIETQPVHLLEQKLGGILLINFFLLQPSFASLVSIPTLRRTPSMQEVALATRSA
jgi:hypothetical protein